jgi:hypothetical protein
MAHNPYQPFGTIRRAVSDYQSAWREYRLLTNWFLALSPGGVGVSVLLVAFSKLFNPFKPGFVLAAAWLILYSYLFIRLSAWRCPRCGKRFSPLYYKAGRFVSARLSFLPSVLLTQSCVHCGLTKYSGYSPKFR